MELRGVKKISHNSGKKHLYVFCPMYNRLVRVKMKCSKGRCKYFVRRILNYVECTYMEGGSVGVEKAGETHIVRCPICGGKFQEACYDFAVARLRDHIRKYHGVELWEREVRF